MIPLRAVPHLTLIRFDKIRAIYPVLTFWQHAILFLGLEKFRRSPIVVSVQSSSVKVELRSSFHGAGLRIFKSSSVLSSSSYFSFDRSKGTNWNRPFANFESFAFLTASLASVSDFLVAVRVKPRSCLWLVVMLSIKKEAFLLIHWRCVVSNMKQSLNKRMIYNNFLSKC